MAHDPSLGFADYFSAADATAVMPAMEEGAPELFGLHADMELLGMRGLMPAAGGSKAGGVLIDAGGADGATMRFLSDGGGQQQPLSLSLCRPDGGVGMTLHQHLGGSSRQPAAWTQEYSHSAAPQWHLRSSRFLVPAQQLLQEFCSLPVDATSKTKAKPSSQEQQLEQDGVGDGSSSSWAASAQIQAMEAVELQRLKDKLYIMLEEVSERSCHGARQLIYCCCVYLIRICEGEKGNSKESTRAIMVAGRVHLRLGHQSLGPHPSLLETSIPLCPSFLLFFPSSTPTRVPYPT